jgi:uncharacterized membrane protein
MNHIVTGVRRQIVGYFLAGLFTILPLVITAAVIIWVAGIIQQLIGPDTLIGGLLRSAGMGLAPGGNTTLAYLIGCLLVLAAIFALGVFVQSGVKRLLHEMVDAVMRRIPIAGSVYGAATQIIGLLEKKDKSDIKTMSVVFCRFGKENGSGILALLPTTQRYPIGGEQYHIVYIPTSPIPMTGGLLFVPADAVTPVDMSVESLMSVYLSMGVTAPQLLGQKQTEAE